MQCVNNNPGGGKPQAEKKMNIYIDNASVPPIDASGVPISLPYIVREVVKQIRPQLVETFINMRTEVAGSSTQSMQKENESEVSLKLSQLHRTCLELQDGQRYLKSVTENTQMQLYQIQEHLNILHNRGQNDDLCMNPDMNINVQYAHSTCSSSEDEKIRNSEFRTGCMAKAFRTHMVDIVERLPFGESEIPDLIIPECVSENECASIRKAEATKDQVRSLVQKVIKRSFPAMTKLLEIIKKHNPELEARIQDTFQDLIEDRTGVRKTCVICMIRNNVNIKDVCDFYYANDMISDELYRNIIDAESHEGSQTYLWNILLGEVSSYPFALVMRIMIEALEKRGTVFSNIVRIIRRDMQKKRHFKCTCQTPQANKMPVSPCFVISDSESSTGTSLEPRSISPERCNSLESNTSSATTIENEETNVKQIVSLLHLKDDFESTYQNRVSLVSETMMGNTNKKHTQEPETNVLETEELRVRIKKKHSKNRTQLYRNKKNASCYHSIADLK